MRALLIVLMAAGLAHADPPDGYRCGQGKAIAGKGCECPKGMAEKRDAENNAICAAAPSSCVKVAASLRALLAKDGDITKKIDPAKHPALLKKVEAILARRCAADKWTAELQACFLAAKVERDLRACKLVKEHEDRLEQEVEAVMAQYEKPNAERAKEAPASEPPAPASPPPSGRVVVKGARVEILEQVYFELTKATIKPVSFPLLDSVADVLAKNPSMRIRVEGHTDSQGNYAANVKLSEDRANTVRAYLVKKGIDASRLEAKGFGPDKPTHDNKTPAGRAANRRIEFHIVSQ
jgi:outer membrane protein OmpA-like peptidoglycan-associated protein